VPTESDPALIDGRAWDRSEPPSAVLAIRLQAFGDVTITLPYLRALRDSLPGTAIDLVTRREDAPLPRAIDLFRHVEGLGGGRSSRLQLLAAAPLVARLALRRYPVVIDLQNNRVSGMIRRALSPRGWSAFDRFSPRSAGERTRLTIEAAGFRLGDVRFELPLRDPGAGLGALEAAGWDPARPLVVLSPSGAMPSRNWPLASWVGFARLWRRRHGAQFAVLGLPGIAPRAEALRAALGDSLLDLVGRTTAPEAMGVVQRASLVLTEDCGLMHVAWTSGVPTLALFGSSRHDWSAPLGAHSRCLHSGDLPCGACMTAACRYGDVHCLTRHTPERIVAVAEELLAGLAGASPRR
jgi:heptosyltransferase II